MNGDNQMQISYRVFYILLTVHRDVILVNEQLDALFLNVFISCLYMFRATSAHHQEGQIVLIHHLVYHTRVGDWRAWPDDVLIKFGPPDAEHLLL
jgi:hypothetical protein